MNRARTLRIRPARAEDQARIEQTVRRARLDRTGLDWHRFKIAELQAEPGMGCPNEAGTPSGEGNARPDSEGKQDIFLGMCQVRHYRGVRELGSLYVRKPYRGQGIGGALIRACLAEQEPPVHLECVEERESYYEGFGFCRIPLAEAPWALRAKSLLGTAVIWLFLRRRIIVMRWDGKGR